MHIVVIFSLASFVYADTGSSAPTNAAPGTNISMLFFNVTNNASTGNVFNSVTVDQTGSASDSNITAVRIINATDSSVLNNTASPSFPITIVLDSTITTNTNFTVQFELSSSATDGETIQANITAITPEENVTFDSTPFNSSLSTIDASGPALNFTSPTPNASANISQNYLEFNVTATSSGASLETITVYLYNSSDIVTSNTSNSSPFFSNFTDLDDAIYTINATTNDTLGNNGTLTSRIVTLDTTAPSVSFSLDRTTVSEGAKITASCSATDNIDTSPSVVFTENPSTSTPGSKSTSCTATDDAGNSKIKTLDYTVAKTGGSGGGSSGTSTKSPKDIFILSSVAAGERISITITKDVGIESIIIDVNTNLNNIRIDVTKLDNKPADTTALPVRIYRFIDIMHTSLEEDYIDLAKIKFSVPREWLDENNIEPQSMILYRFSGGKWNELNTIIVTMNQDSINYEATTPGFSFFAIGEKESSEQPQPIEEEDQQENTTITDEPSQDKPRDFTILIVILLIVTIYLIIRYDIINVVRKMITSKK